MRKALLSILTLASTITASAGEVKDTKIVAIEVTDQGFVPSSINVKPGTSVTLEITRKTDSTCATEVQVPSLKIKKTSLPLNQKVTLALGTLKMGEVKFGCGMNMMDSGKVIVK